MRLESIVICSFYFLAYTEESCGHYELLRRDLPDNDCAKCIIGIAKASFARGSLIGVVMPRESNATNCHIRLNEISEEMQWTFLIRSAIVTAYDLTEVSLSQFWIRAGFDWNFCSIPDYIESCRVRGQLHHICDRSRRLCHCVEKRSTQRHLECSREIHYRCWTDRWKLGWTHHSHIRAVLEALRFEHCGACRDRQVW